MRAAEPAWLRSQQVHSGCLLSAVPLFHRKMKPHKELPSRSEHSLSPPQKAVDLCHGPSSAPSAAPSPLQTTPAHRPWRLQCRNPILFLPVFSLWSLLESYMWLPISACKAASSPFSPWHRWAQGIPWQGVPQGGSVWSPLIPSPSAYPCNFISQSVCRFTRQGRVERNEWKSFHNDLRYFT